MRKGLPPVGILVVALALADAASAATPTSASQPLMRSQMTVVPLRNGANDIDLDGDGRTDLIFVARRDNGNAHGYDLFTFYHRSAATSLPWDLVPFFKANGAADGDNFTTHEGADCVLRGVVVLRPPSTASSPVTVVVGQRELGQSYSDAAPVKFVVYRIARNDEGIPGWPPVYLQEDQTIVARSIYCDIAEAFKSELGIRMTTDTTRHSPKPRL